jgi:hypothetical protein
MPSNLQKPRMSIYRHLAILLFFIPVAVPAAAGKTGVIIYQDGALGFEWNYFRDKAQLFTLPAHTIAWQGSLLPAFWLQANQKKQFIKATVISDSLAGNEIVLQLAIGLLGKGKLLITKENWGIRFARMEIRWNRVPAIIEMYFGTSNISNSPIRPGWDRPFLPDWQSTGFCVPGAKGGTPQSFFRSWDFGQATVALGSFGPSMGSPYGAAYPRPVLYAAMGSDEGCIAIGAGTIPDAAMSLKVLSTKGCFQYVYCEDVWGKPVSPLRVWQEPLRITFGENAWMAFKKYYHSFPPKLITRVKPPPPTWNTWGMWAQAKYVIRPISDFAKMIGAGLLVMDGSWESMQGEGKSNNDRFPHFSDDISYTNDKGIQTGIWESVGWIADPFSNGLHTSDLICDRKGLPCKANWNFDPASESYYCMDISSEAVRNFIRQRTIHLMNTIQPKLVKLDFGYGLPDPYMGVPKNPAFRGECYPFELIKLISQVAKSIDPDVAIMYYGISPLCLNDLDIISLDDQGDLWYETVKGHDEWSIWASLLSDRHIAVSGSSGYRWDLDDEAVLNTCIIGSPGAVLPLALKNEAPVPAKYLNRRLAINHWFRKTIDWEPLWLNSERGNFSTPPRLNCWGRLEINGPDTVLTALALRENEKEKMKDARVNTITWTGRWALISQDSESVFSSGKLALIPFDAGTISLPFATKPVHISRLNMEGEQNFEGWTWENGFLNIRVTDESIQNTAGFVINR